MASSAVSSSLDFEALLTRDYRPARVTELNPRDLYRPSSMKSHLNKASTAALTADILGESEKAQEDEASRIVLSLVTQTRAFTRHLGIEPGSNPPSKVISNFLTSQRQVRRDFSRLDKIDPLFHEIELGEWENQINWGGLSAVPSADRDALPKAGSFLGRRRNPYLESLELDETTVCWDGDREKLLAKAKEVPLILELGVAGLSVAKHVYQHTVLSAQRPVPALKSDEYQDRLDREINGPITSTAELSKSLHTDKEKMEALIEARQRKRAQMAKDKTSRVTEAMGTLALGGGRGRTITSSLMGPGGTERTGRPTRAANSSAAHEREYVEQLDLVNSHTIVRDLSTVMQRQYHRPKLPLSVSRQDLSWQFQIRYCAKTSANSGKEGAPSSSASYTMMMGSTPGALSKVKIRTEADLSPTEGNLVLVEYTEERPPIQLTKGMAFKIVNYYRGDKAHCPVSAGGGDRPARRKTQTESRGTFRGSGSMLPKRLETADKEIDIQEWVGKIPKRAHKEHVEKEAFDVLPEGVTEILHPKVHGPFIGEIENGTTLTGIVSNLFVAPMGWHEPESTDFLLILTPGSGASKAGQRESLGVVLRDLPASCFTVGQILPRAKVYAPNTQGEKAFTGPYISYLCARVIARSQAREGRGLTLNEIQERVLPYLDLPPNALRQRLKQVAVSDNSTWTLKQIGFEDFPGLDSLGKSISPEGIAAFETALAASQRLADLGIHHLVERGSHTVVSVGVAMVYLAGHLHATKDLARKMKKLSEISKTNKSIQGIQAKFYEKAANELDSYYKTLRQKYEVAQFIFEELQLAPWHLTVEFIDVHKKGEGTGMMKLTGLGDPSGMGEGFSFLREADSKPSKSVGNAALNSQIKKITGTENDLRKLTMKQMAALLRSYGMPQKKIDTLKRWDRVHVIRDLSTKAASDGVGDGLERFARGEKMKLSEQKQMYQDRVQVIWKRQLAMLASDLGERGAAIDTGAASSEHDLDAPATSSAPSERATSTNDNDDSDDDSEDDDDLAAELEDEMMDRSETNQLLAAQTRGSDDSRDLGQLRAAAQDQDLTKDARELAALKRQREEERAAGDGMQARPSNDATGGTLGIGRKVIRKKITKTHPDGKQTVTFKFVLHPEEVGKIMAKLQQKSEDVRRHPREFRYEYGVDEKPPGHAMFEDDDDFEYSSRGRLPGGRRSRKGRRGASGRGTPRSLHTGKLKKTISLEERMRKRKREEDELDAYVATSKRKGTNNRRERGSIRDRAPHVIYAEKLEAIRAAVEARPYAGPFQKPVNRRLIPTYYEVISHPMDLSTIRDRIGRYEYKSIDRFVRDFELMKNNAIKFNGETNTISQEAIAIYEFVKDTIDAQRNELEDLEAAVEDQMTSKPKKKRKKNSAYRAFSSRDIDIDDFEEEGLDDSDSDNY
ncbi:transcription initiation factor TFIID subunit 1 [Fistulifera solaris]|uniref:Transcription initiation factor TFIID subunit 1 n=1 Tax=Fistulifera solaris TaxID=1519565 RepID=A0A1Z5JXC1_FISSO|nr:transcription initiation factor TFIID subunit 1 [Fistulifera solaris]|eukprot:GAX18391.1 transcription initiation factor TFIID subunit 1 [Fistulifera solaris]